MIELDNETRNVYILTSYRDKSVTRRCSETTLLEIHFVYAVQQWYNLYIQPGF